MHGWASFISIQRYMPLRRDRSKKKYCVIKAVSAKLILKVTKWNTYQNEPFISVL